MGHRRAGTSALWLIPFLLSLFGLVVIAAMTGFEVHSSGMKQLVWLAFSLLVFIGVVIVPLQFWYRISYGQLILALVLTLLTLIPGLGVSIKGASRWLRMGPVSFQPAELLSLAVLLALCRYYNNHVKLNSLTATGALLLVVGGLLMCQPDLGSLLLVVGIMGALFVQFFGWFIPLLLAVPGGFFVYFFLVSGYRMDRIETWLNPWADPMGKGYQVIQGLIAFANGGLWGVGINRSQDFLPEVHNDFIFPAIGEQFGLAGSLAVMAAFFIWTFFVFQAYRKVSAPRRPLIWACCVSVLLPFLINVGGVTQMIPLTGMPLPFISYGGTSLLFMWVRVGLLVKSVTE